VGLQGTNRSVGGVLLLTMFCGLCSNGCKAEPWPLWEQYAAKYVDKDSGRVIDNQAGGRTTSEGQAYAMFFALVAGDRTRFDKLLHWTEDNLAGGDMTAHLPAWEWGKAADGSWKVMDANSATDADLWMSYTLVQAGKLWNDARYKNMGEFMAKRIAHDEVTVIPTIGPVLMPGGNGFHPDATTWILNPSYEPLPLIEQMATIQPDGPWSAMVEALPKFLTAASAGGFVMDWVEYSTTSGWKPIAQPGQTDVTEALGSYDAIRVYLWTGISDSGTPQMAACMGSLSGMATYMRGALLPPAKVDEHGMIVNADGTAGFSAAVLPYLEAVGEKKQAADQLERVSATRDSKTGLFGREQNYYDQNLALFGLGWYEQRFHFEKDGHLKVQWK
jgi:endo-1,4-beta-D-glucanase Y